MQGVVEAAKCVLEVFGVLKGLVDVLKYSSMEMRR